MKVLKVLNSSVVLAVDEYGYERILLGKGIGFSSKKGDIIPERQVEKTFIPLLPKETDSMLQLLQTVSPKFIELARRIVELASASLKAELSSHIYVALTDHLHFANERYKSGIILSNRLLWEIKKFYPCEFAVALKSIDMIREELGIELPEEEAGNIAFHLVNAQNENSSMHETMKHTQLLNQLIAIIRYSSNTDIDEDSIHYDRFISHMHFFIKRMFDGKMLEEDDNILFLQINDANSTAVKCTNQIIIFLEANYKIDIPKEERIYLTVHIQRILLKN